MVVSYDIENPIATVLLDTSRLTVLQAGSPVLALSRAAVDIPLASLEVRPTLLNAARALRIFTKILPALEETLIHGAQYSHFGLYQEFQILIVKVWDWFISLTLQGLSALCKIRNISNIFFNSRLFKHLLKQISNDIPVVSFGSYERKTFMWKCYKLELASKYILRSDTAPLRILGSEGLQLGTYRAKNRKFTFPGLSLQVSSPSESSNHWHTSMASTVGRKGVVIDLLPAGAITFVCLEFKLASKGKKWKECWWYLSSGLYAIFVSYQLQSLLAIMRSYTKICHGTVTISTCYL